MLSTLALVLILLSASLANAQKLTLTWRDNSSGTGQEDGFIIEKKFSTDTDFLPRATVGQDVETFVDTDIIENTSYTYRVKAFNTVGESPYSNEASGVFVPLEPPDAPESLICSISESLPFLFSEDFESESSIDWQDTIEGNSFVVDDTIFTVVHEGTNHVFNTELSTVNYHSHYIGPGSNDWKNYSFTGRMRISNTEVGMGVTFLSEFPLNVNRYYRLRRYTSEPTFHISPHGTLVTGDIDSGVNPEINIWYKFHIKTISTITHTEIKANVWKEGTPEPIEWQIDVIDTSANRIQTGTIGLWGMSTSTNRSWDDLVVTPIN